MGKQFSLVFFALLLLCTASAFAADTPGRDADELNCTATQIPGECVFKTDEDMVSREKAMVAAYKEHLAMIATERGQEQFHKLQEIWANQAGTLMCGLSSALGKASPEALEGAKSCLSDLYDVHTNELTIDVTVFPDGSEMGVTPDRSVVRMSNAEVFARTEVDISKQIIKFDTDLGKHVPGKRVRDCSSAISIHATARDGDTSYGGVCSLEDQNGPDIVAVCGDDMVGHFAMKSIDPALFSRKQLIEFVAANCMGG